MSHNLAGICWDRGFQVYVGDVLAVPLRENTFDVCLCIAVIHHMSTLVSTQPVLGQLIKLIKTSN